MGQNEMQYLFDNENNCKNVEIKKCEKRKKRK